MLLFSPRWLFLVPGLLTVLVSALVYLRLLAGPWSVGSVTLDVHTLFFAQTGVVLGVLGVLTGFTTRALGAKDGSFTERRYLAVLRSSPAPEVGAAGRDRPDRPRDGLGRSRARDVGTGGLRGVGGG